MQKFGDAFVRGDDLGLTRTLRRLLLADRLPGDGTAASTDEEAGEGAKFKKFNRGAIGNGVPDLATPTYIAEFGELMAFGGRGEGCVGVGLLVVVVGEVGEGL